MITVLFVKNIFFMLNLLSSALVCVLSFIFQCSEVKMLCLCLYLNISGSQFSSSLRNCSPNNRKIIVFV